MSVNKKNKISKFLLFVEIVLYISIACGMAYAIINWQTQIFPFWFNCFFLVDVFFKVETPTTTKIIERLVNVSKNAFKVILAPFN